LKNALRSLIAVAALSAALIPSAVLASGTVRVEQSGGQVRYYHHVALALHSDTLRIVSPDHVGTLIVKRAACFATSGLQRCFPTELVLSQHGTHRISFRRGTLYLNLSDEPRVLPHSSKVIGARGVVALLETMHGTFIEITGRLDEVNP
jgi:hypothetical protein